MPRSRATTCAATPAPSAARSATSRRTPASTVRHRPREPDAPGPRPGHGRPELRERVDRLLDLVGIADAADRVVRGYSGGMRRRLDIALGLVHQPQVLFLDEPTTGLDPEARVQMWEEVARLAHRRRLTILLTTHYLEEADELADRLAIVSRGADRRRGRAGGAEGAPPRRRRPARARRTAGWTTRDAWSSGSAPPRERDRRADPRLAGRRTAAARCRGSSPRSSRRGSPSSRSRVSRPSLDDVYLHYTGREFAAEDRGEA